MTTPLMFIPLGIFLSHAHEYDNTRSLTIWDSIRRGGGLENTHTFSCHNKIIIRFGARSESNLT